MNVRTVTATAVVSLAVLALPSAAQAAPTHTTKAASTPAWWSYSGTHNPVGSGVSPIRHRPPVSWPR